MSRKITGKGSFRGVAFLIEDNQSINGGRRLVKHEYPLRDDGLNEDLGKKLRSYQVNCLVIGDDHIEQAERLVEVLEQSGKGTLKHPHFGELEVIVEDYSLTHSTNHQRVSRFDITFVPALAEIAPKIAEDTLYGVLDSYATTIDELAQEYAETIENVSEFIESLVDNPVFRLAESVTGFVETVFQGADTALLGLSTINDYVVSFKGRLTALLLQPKVLATELQSLTKLGVSSIVTSTRSNGQIAQYSVAVNTMRETLATTTFRKTEVSQGTLDAMMAAKKNNMSESAILTKYFSALHEQEVFDALIAKTVFVTKRLVEATMVVEFGTAIANTLTDSVAQKVATEDVTAGLLESKAEVRRYINDIDGQLEEVILAAADAESWDSYAALEQFHSDLLADLRVRGEQLSNAKVVKLKDTFPAILLEYRYTNNAKTWKRLALRNGITHPLFCVGGNEIEVLN